jgi:hypothetical protein
MRHVHVHAVFHCPCCTFNLHVHAVSPCCISIASQCCMSVFMLESMSTVCCMSTSTLYINAVFYAPHPCLHTCQNAACSCPCCMFMSMQHVLLSMSIMHACVDTACPCPRASTFPFCLPIFMLHVHVCLHAECPCWMSKLHVHVAYPCRMSCCIYMLMSMMHIMLLVNAACPCYMSMMHIMLLVNAACPCYMSMLHVHVSILHVHHICTIWEIRKLVTRRPVSTKVPFTPRFVSKNTHDHCHISNKKFEPKFCLELA